MTEETEPILPYNLSASDLNYGSTQWPSPEGDMGVKTQDFTTPDEEGRKLPQYMAALASTLGAFAAGAVLAYTSPTEKELRAGALGFAISEQDFNWVGSLTPLGAMFMCVCVGSILDILGRKITMLAVIGVFTLGWALVIWASNVWMLMAGRFITGMAGGTFCVAAPLYTSEIAQKEIRGTLGSYFQLMLTIGILFTYTIGKFVEPKELAIISAIVPFIFGLAFVFMPESPIFKLKKGDITTARANLQWLRGPNYNIDNEIADIQKSLQEDKDTPITIKESFKKRATQKSIIICFGLMAFQQLSGINAVIFYSSKIFDKAGTGLDPKTASIIVGCMQVLATLISTFIIDRGGRRILLLLSIGVMSICACFLGIYFYLMLHVPSVDIHSIAFLPVTSLSIFVIMFSFGFGPIPWMICAEVFPREIKSVASSAAGTFNWFLAFLITKFFNDVSIAIGEDATFFMFMGICAIGFVFVFLVVIETKGKSLEQIQMELNGSHVRTAESGVVNGGFTGKHIRSTESGVVNEGFSGTHITPTESGVVNEGFTS